MKASNAFLYGGSTLPDFKNIYIVGTSQPRYGFGPLLTPAADLICRFVEVQDKMELPIGLVLKELGARLPPSHLIDPHQSLRQMRKIKDALPLLLRKERKLRKLLEQESLLVPRPNIERARPNPDLPVF